MAGPLLQTKLHLPRQPRSQVARPRLGERLARGWESTLTLVSAPAGFGKTTLLTEWLAAAPTEGRSVAWLSLDQRDNDPASFWTYLVAALQTAAPEVGASALPLLQSPTSSAEPFLATLLNDLAAVAHDVVLVLDDYHVVETRDVHDGVAFLLDHLPSQVHLVIAGRADPGLPLARLRGRGELVEIRAADLRFTAEEASAYLNGAMGLGLTAQDVAALEGRTEGWIAALQLAALSMQGRDDVGGFIAGFAGDDRYIVDYLAEEVLQRQPDEVRTFLLQTSVLGRLTGSLCDALTGRAGGRAMLETLERGNLFLVPLDDRRRWYRYHHLFADVLRARLLDEHPDLVAELHRRASAWFEQNDGRSEAIHHAMSADDVARAADLVELAIPAMRQGRREVTLRRWLEALPDEVIRSRPVLSVAYAGTLLIVGELDGVEGRLRDAERRLDDAAPAGERSTSSPTAEGGPASSATAENGPAASATATAENGPAASATATAENGSAASPRAADGALRGLRSSIAVYRAAQARARGDLAGTVTHARRALDLVDEGDLLGRGAAAGLLALAYWTSGDLGAAHHWWADSRTQFERAEFRSDVMGISIALSDVEVAQGRLREARRTLERALRAGTGRPDQPPLRGVVDMHVGLGEVAREQGDLEAARRHLRTSLDLGEQAGLPQSPYRRRVAMARLRVAEGDLGGAVDLLDEAERLYVGDFFPDVRPVASVRARVRLAQGEVGDAVGWARERGLSVDDDLSYLREFEHLTLARVLLARDGSAPLGRPRQDATRFLDRLLRAADDGGRTGSVIEILVLQALALQARGDVAAAMPPLHRALALAEPEGYVRVLADEGSPMATLLRSAAKEGTSGSYVRRLLAAAGTTERDAAPAGPGLVEGLSSRELDVLRLLATDLDGPDIARQLFVSLNTMRTHTRNVYAKLGVNSRRAAVRRAEELGLLGRTGGH